MSTYLGPRQAQGVVDLSNPLGAGFWTVSFTPRVLGWQIPCEIYHIALSGPTGSAFQVWLDTNFYDYVNRGDINSWDPAQPMAYIPGQTIYFYWDTATGTAPKVTVYGRE